MSRRLEFEERAAVLEFDGGLSRDRRSPGAGRRGASCHVLLPWRTPKRTKAWESNPQAFALNGGARRDRTVDLYNAIVALSQLSYGPEILALGQ